MFVVLLLVFDALKGAAEVLDKGRVHLQERREGGQTSPMQSVEASSPYPQSLVLGSDSPERLPLEAEEEPLVDALPVG